MAVSTRKHEPDWRESIRNTFWGYAACHLLPTPKCPPWQGAVSLFIVLGRARSLLQAGWMVSEGTCEVAKGSPASVCWRAQLGQNRVGLV